MSYQVSYGGQPSSYGYTAQYPYSSSQYPQRTTTTTTHYTQQSHGDPNVVVVNRQPVTTMAPRTLLRQERDWSSGLCDCCHNICRCCYAFWCYPCFVGSLSEKMGEGWCKACCSATAKFGGYPNGFLSSLRTKMRSNYGIQGTVCKDCCLSMWCELCVALQMDRELQHSGNMYK